MRRADKEFNDPEIIKHVIKNAPVCHVAFVNDNKPYIVPVSYGISGKELYFHSAFEGRKIDILKVNPNICFQIESDVSIVEHKIPCKWSFRYRSIIGTGVAEILTDNQDKNYGMSVIMKQYSEKTFHFPPEVLEKTALIKVRILTMTTKQSGF